MSESERNHADMPSRQVPPSPIPPQSARQVPNSVPVAHGQPGPPQAVPSANSAVAAPPAAAPPAGSPPPATRPQPTAEPPKSAPSSATADPSEVTDEGPGLFAVAREMAGRVFSNSPAWLVSLIVHMVVILLMALLTLPIAGNQPLVMQLLSDSDSDSNLESLQDLQLESLDVPDSETVSYDTANSDNIPAAAAIPKTVQSVFESSPLNAPSIRNGLRGREARSKAVLLLAYGGTDMTETAVKEALIWLARQQKKDGSWSLTGPYPDGGVEENRAAATAMALLAFQGAGNTHLQGLYKTVVENGMQALLRLQDSEGNFFREGPTHHRLYTQAQATIAVCELFGMTRDEELRIPAERAIEYAVKNQSPEGGWRYEPGRDSDTSVTGWFVIALQSARMAGLQVPQKTLDRVTGFLNTVQKDGGAQYSYVPNRGASNVMSAEALLCRQYLGWGHDDPRLRKGVRLLLRSPINWDVPNTYYWYYAAQVAHHMGGQDWADWNSVMREVIPANQVASGRNKGSWNPGSDRWGQSAGRLYMTCLCTYMLEVYYRHLPIYQHIEVPEL